MTAQKIKTRQKKELSTYEKKVMISIKGYDTIKKKSTQKKQVMRAKIGLRSEFGKKMCKGGYRTKGDTEQQFLR